LTTSPLHTIERAIGLTIWRAVLGFTYNAREFLLDRTKLSSETSWQKPMKPPTQNFSALTLRKMFDRHIQPPG